ncbi:MAG TPA: hypothetical protein P5224_13490 [Mesotoga sp.]|nr:hypothetical protein [Mesotoga sp.]
MSSLLSSLLPHSLDRIQLRAIGRKEFKDQLFLMLLQPRLEHFCMMVSTVVQDQA